MPGMRRRRQRPGWSAAGSAVTRSIRSPSWASPHDAAMLARLRPRRPIRRLSTLAAAAPLRMVRLARTSIATRTRVGSRATRSTSPPSVDRCRRATNRQPQADSQTATASSAASPSECRGFVIERSSHAVPYRRLIAPGSRRGADAAVLKGWTQAGTGSSSRHSIRASLSSSSSWVPTSTALTRANDRRWNGVRPCSSIPRRWSSVA